MKTFLLIVNYNDADTTINLLNVIKDYRIIDKIVIVDNKSTDNSVDKLQTRASKKIVIIQNKENKGYASGINFGCKYIEKTEEQCNIIVSNADIVIHSEEDIRQLIISKKQDCAIIAPVIKEHSGYNRGWKIPTPMQDAILNIIGIHKILRPMMLFYPDKYYSNDVVDVEVVSGCFFLIDSKILKDINYFDENTFLYYEENIVSSKIKNIGKKIYINTKIEVFHNHSVTIDKNINHLKKYIELKKSQYYFHKTYNHANKLSLLFLKITSKLSYFLIKYFRKNN